MISIYPYTSSSFIANKHFILGSKWPLRGAKPRTMCLEKTKDRIFTMAPPSRTCTSHSRRHAHAVNEYIPPYMKQATYWLSSFLHEKKKSHLFVKHYPKHFISKSKWRKTHQKLIIMYIQIYSKSMQLANLHWNLSAMQLQFFGWFFWCRLEECA